MDAISSKSLKRVPPKPVKKGEIVLLPAIWWDSIDGGQDMGVQQSNGPFSPHLGVALESHQQLLLVHFAHLLRSLAVTLCVTTVGEIILFTGK